MRPHALLTVCLAASCVAAPYNGPCPYQATPDSALTSLHTMLAEVSECSKTSDAFTRSLMLAEDTDAYRRVFAAACVNVAAVRACVDDIDATADACLEGTRRGVWTTVVEFVRTGMAATCGDGGELVASIYGDELRAMDEGHGRRTVSCLYSIASGSLFGNENDLAAFTLRKYNALKDGTRCIVNVAKDGRTGSTQFQRFMNQLIVNMKCLSPATNEVVLCSTIPPAGPAA